MVATTNSNMTDIILIDNNYEIHFDISQYSMITMNLIDDTKTLILLRTSKYEDFHYNTSYLWQ